MTLPSEPDEPRLAAARAVRATIRGVLLEAWDPLGIRDVPGRQDAYDPVIAPMYRLLASGEGPLRLAAELAEAERRMDRKTPVDALLPVARRLRALDVELHPIRLVNITPELAAVISDPAAVARVLQTEAYRATTGAPVEWGGFLVADASARVVGIGGFKGAPREAAVEIAYGTLPPHEGRGVATRTAAALVERAIASGEVRLVFAHTLAEPHASNRLLRRHGFAYAGEHEDPEDGRVWRWELPVTADAAARRPSPV